MNLSKSEQLVLDYLKSTGKFTSPTEIGRKVGGRSSGGQPRHSSWASPICKRLVKKGLVERSGLGHYRVLT